MNRVRHETAAGSEEAAAEGHAREARATAAPAPTARAGEVLALGNENCVPAQTVCWTASSNRTDEHRQAAARHRKLAAQHRAASEALVAAEQRDCAGIDEENRDVSPFHHTDDIVSISEADGTEMHGRVNVTHAAGATVVFRAVPGMTQQWLQRAVDCHLARAAVVGPDATYMPYCPLMVKGASASVRALSNGFAVDIRSTDASAAQEIYSRAQRLKSNER